ncbi:MAG TPA: hypothetical protein VGW34_06215 [Allosphingosinicella sp.]|nr:hypothetical protein [Allosphingosinicella sp.]
MPAPSVFGEMIGSATGERRPATAKPSRTYPYHGLFGVALLPAATTAPQADQRPRSLG